MDKEMATHSSILAWRIPWTEEPGGLQSMGTPATYKAIVVSGVSGPVPPPQVRAAGLLPQGAELDVRKS